jgi:hypothetical protein
VQYLEWRRILVRRTTPFENLVWLCCLAQSSGEDWKLICTRWEVFPQTCRGREEVEFTKCPLPAARGMPKVTHPSSVRYCAHWKSSAILLALFFTIRFQVFLHVIFALRLSAPPHLRPSRLMPAKNAPEGTRPSSYLPKGKEPVSASSVFPALKQEEYSALHSGAVMVP